MDSKILKNFLKTAQLGSLSAAAQEACVTVQALAAQLNKLEQQLGFRLFDRTNKGVTLTDEGRDILPWVTDVVKSSAELQHRAAHLRQRGAPALHIALNNTFPDAVNQALMTFLRDRLSAWPLIFSTSESPENLAKLARDEADIGVIIGDRLPAGLYAVNLPGLNIEVVAASAGMPVNNDTVLIKPMPECAYSDCFERFVSRYKNGYAKLPVHYSGSEHISVAMIKSSNSIGIISRRVALMNNLTILPEFTDALSVTLLMKTPLLSDRDLAAFTPDPPLPLSA